jgi:hypothetical protein
MKKYISIILLIFSFSLNAQDLKSKTRPDIFDALKEHSNYKPGANIPRVTGRFNPPKFLEAIKKDAPLLIAQLEYAYPGAKFVFMGRDTQLLADVLDAFYLSIGQKDRVVKLGVSKPTLANLDNSQVMKYLEYYGLNLKTIEKNPSFILVDTVSSGETIDGILISGRQGRSLLQTIYSEWIKAGNDAKKLLSKVNMVGLLVSTFHSDDPSNKKRFKKINKLDEINRKNESIVSEDINKIGRNFVIGAIPDTANLINEAGYDHHTGAWHNKFQNPVLKNGNLLPNPGSLTDISERKSIVWMQHQLIDLIRNADFIQRTFKEAKRLGIEFSTTLSCRSAYK